jgi:hypothetical protein
MIPVVLLTTSASERDITRAYCNHANSYLLKKAAIRGMIIRPDHRSRTDRDERQAAPLILKPVSALRSEGLMGAEPVPPMDVPMELHAALIYRIFT